MVALDQANKCTRLAGTSKEYSYWSLLNQSDIQGGLSLMLNTGDPCPNGGNYSVIMNITCDSNTSAVIFDNTNEFSLNKCTNTLTGKSKRGKIDILN